MNVYQHDSFSVNYANKSVSSSDKAIPRQKAEVASAMQKQKRNSHLALAVGERRDVHEAVDWSNESDIFKRKSATKVTHRRL